MSAIVVLDDEEDIFKSNKNLVSNSDSGHEASASQPKVEQSATPLRACLICSSVEEEDILHTRLQNCNHVVCSDCATKHLRTALDPTQLPAPSVQHAITQPKVLENRQFSKNFSPFRFLFCLNETSANIFSLLPKLLYLSQICLLIEIFYFPQNISPAFVLCTVSCARL
jgi:hypothetical protein